MIFKAFHVVYNLFFKYRTFIQANQNQYTQSMQWLIVSWMLVLAILFNLIELFMGEPYQVYGLIVQLVLHFGFLIGFPLILSIAVNIAGGQSHYRDAFQLTTSFFVINLYYLILIPLKLIMLAGLAATLSNPAYNRMLFLYPVILIVGVVLLFMVVHLIVLMSIGIKHVYQLTTEKTAIVLIATCLVVIFIEIVLLIPVYAFKG